MRSFYYRDNVFSFEGCVSVQTEDKWCRPWRIEFSHIDLFPFVSERAGEASGIRLSFETDSKNIMLLMKEGYEGMKLDLFINGRMYEQYACDGNKKILFRGLHSCMKKVEIWLDPNFPFKLHEIGIDDNSSIKTLVFNQKRWVHYGSSISHSKQAASPSAIWTGLVAQKTNLHLTNLGFGGNCILEPMVGKMIRDLPADMVTMKLGVNCHSGALSYRSFEPNAIGLISIIREKNPQIPIVIISPIYAPEKENNRASDISLTLVEMREILKKVVDKFREYGDNNIRYADGLKLLGPEQEKYLPDKIHPDADGQYIMADNFIKNIIPHNFIQDAL